MSKSKPRAPKRLSENMEERLLASYCRTRGFPQHHIANEGKRPDPRTMAGLKAKGFTGGFPDHIVVIPGLAVLFIEMKAKGEEPSDAQKAWLASLYAAGTPAVWCDSAADAIRWIETIEQERKWLTPKLEPVEARNGKYEGQYNG